MTARPLLGKPLVHWLRCALIAISLGVALACGSDGDERMVRNHADCLANPYTSLHRLTVSNEVGTVPLNAEAMEARLHSQLERREVTMAEIRTKHARYCD